MALTHAGENNGWVLLCSLQNCIYLLGGSGAPGVGGWGWGWGTPSLRVSSMRRGFAPLFRHLDDLFAPKIWPCLLFYSDLVGSHFEAPHFQHIDAPFAPQIDQIYHFIQILLGPVLNFERRNPTDFDPPPGAEHWLVVSLRDFVTIRKTLFIYKIQRNQYNQT